MNARVVACVLVGLALAWTGVAAAAPKAPPLAPAPTDGLARALASGQVSEAHYALERARALFRPARVSERFGVLEPGAPRSATFVLRDLAVRIGDLAGPDRAAAERLLARPTDRAADPFDDGWPTNGAAHRVCSARACVHWVTGPGGAPIPDSPPLDDGDLNDVPDWVDETLDHIHGVFAVEVDDIGFPLPKDDSTSDTAPEGNPNGLIDVFLADIGDAGLYGYCATDDPNAADLETYDVSAYCVVDDDFSPHQFIGVTGQDANKVTLAHELHHAEQFALDFAEDLWIMEAGATFMERVVFPGIHDNYQYLFTSPITQPGRPLDWSNPFAGNVYGAWIFFQYLSERFGGPELVRSIWARLDARPGAPDRYSIQGVKRYLASLNRPLKHVFADFALANRTPRGSYELTGLPQGLRSSTNERYYLGRNRPAAGRAWRSRHLAARWIVFKRRSDARRNADLHLSLDLPPRLTSPAAKVVVVRQGTREISPFRLTRNGNAQATVPFGHLVSKVELLLVNAGARYRCWRGNDYSCQGEPRDGDLLYAFRASIR